MASLLAGGSFSRESSATAVSLSFELLLLALSFTLLFPRSHLTFVSSCTLANARLLTGVPSPGSNLSQSASAGQGRARRVKGWVLVTCCCPWVPPPRRSPASGRTLQAAEPTFSLVGVPFHYWPPENELRLWFWFLLSFFFLAQNF